MQLSAARINRRFEFVRRRQLFIGAHNETFSVALRVSNPRLFARRNPLPKPQPQLRMVSDETGFHWGEYNLQST